MIAARVRLGVSVEGTGRSGLVRQREDAAVGGDGRFVGEGLSPAFSMGAGRGCRALCGMVGWCRPFQEVPGCVRLV
ncbi:hypothetical protein GCM10009733_008370 [Nonomuraea maheshkhaliensis]|uniref:Uncharacterized protein n=1 Tax=Nonomuraea maheshkhaliensis TaxID=419590 RepID=A0ABP4QM44_9ACTN